MSFDVGNMISVHVPLQTVHRDPMASIVETLMAMAPVKDPNSSVKDNRTIRAQPEPKKCSVSLVTSFWGEAIHVNQSEPQATHEHEIAASILNNLNNPHLHQVVVILDSSTVDARCNHFQAKMADLQHQFIVWSNKRNRTTRNTEKSLTSMSTKLTCVDREQEQPNYYEMFQYPTDTSTVVSKGRWSFL
jgi:hypothetical protein